MQGECIHKKTYKGVIYVWTNKENGKRYVGQTTKERERKKQHIREAFRECGKRKKLSAFHSAMRQFGLECFSYNVLKKISASDKATLAALLDKYEEYYIKKYKSCLTEFGYNQTVDGKNANGLNCSYNKNERFTICGTRKQKKIKPSKQELIERKKIEKEKKKMFDKHVSGSYVAIVNTLCKMLEVPCAIIIIPEF